MKWYPLPAPTTGREAVASVIIGVVCVIILVLLV